MVGPHLRCEAAGRGNSRDGLLEREEFRGDGDVNEEDPGAIKGVECSESNLDGCVAQFAQVHSDAFILLQCGAAQKLQSDVPGFWRGPAEGVRRALGTQTMYRCSEIGCHGGGEWDADEETQDLPSGRLRMRILSGPLTLVSHVRIRRFLMHWYRNSNYARMHVPRAVVASRRASSVVR